MSKINKSYELIIIGAGSAGLAAARKAELNKVKTALINAGLPITGTCLNVGCIPSKRLAYAAKLLYYGQKQIFEGISLQVKQLDFNTVINSMEELILKWQEHNKQEVNSFKFVDYYKDWAEFISPNQVKVGDYILEAEKFIIATGSSSIIPKHILNTQKVNLLTTENIFFLKELPKKLTVIGAGASGLELAQVYSRFGSEVTILELKDHIFSNEERELTDKLQKILESESINIVTKAIPHRVYYKSNADGQEHKAVLYTKNNQEYEILSDQILIAAGKVPNTEKLNLEKSGIKISKNKAIKVNKYLQTTASNIYAAGDVIDMPLRIKTTASQEGTNAFDNAIFNKKKTIDYKKVPYALFTDPQLGYIGLSEKDILDNKDKYKVLKLTFSQLTKANLNNNTEGEIKIIIDKTNNQIKGVHILSDIASELIYQSALAIYNNNTIEDIINTFPVFPTLSECLKLAINKNS